MKVFCSGISGVGATEYIKNVVQYGHSKGEEIAMFNVGQEVIKFSKECGAPITPTGVLDLNKSALRYLTGGAYKEIARQIDNYKHCIIDGHLNFRWRGTMIDAATQDIVRSLEPEMYVTLMDLVRPIAERLKNDTKQWKYEFEKGNLNLANILDWQKVEVQTTSQWAATHKKPMYVLPTKDSADSLFKLTTCKKAEVAYVSFPISHIRDDAESQQKIDQFVTELRRFKNLAIISPRALMLPENPSEIENQYTVMQDLEWFVEKSTKRIFVYFPKKVYSRGVDHESIRAKESCKEVWFIAPKEMDDPFTNSTIHQRFYSPEECIKKILESGMEQE